MRTFPSAGLAPAHSLRVLAGVGLLFSVGVTTPTLAGPMRPGYSNVPRVSAVAQKQRRMNIVPFATLRARLDDSDRITALHALQTALNQTEDGGTFMWKKNNRDLMGVIKPTAAFRNAEGEICRHVIYAISLGEFRKQIEVVACREADGRWRL